MNTTIVKKFSPFLQFILAFVKKFALFSEFIKKTILSLKVFSLDPIRVFPTLLFSVFGILFKTLK